VPPRIRTEPFDNDEGEKRNPQEEEDEYWDLAEDETTENRGTRYAGMGAKRNLHPSAAWAQNPDQASSSLGRDKIHTFTAVSDEESALNDENDRSQPTFYWERIRGATGSQEGTAGGYPFPWASSGGAAAGASIGVGGGEWGGDSGGGNILSLQHLHHEAGTAYEGWAAARGDVHSDTQQSRPCENKGKRPRERNTGQQGVPLKMRKKNKNKGKNNNSLQGKSSEHLDAAKSPPQGPPPPPIAKVLTARQLQQRWEGRQKRIERWKSTQDYIEYLRLVPKHTRTVQDPMTPTQDAQRHAPKREWKYGCEHWQRGVKDRLKLALGNEAKSISTRDGPVCRSIDDGDDDEKSTNVRNEVLMKTGIDVNVDEGSRKQFDVNEDEDDDDEPVE